MFCLKPVEKHLALYRYIYLTDCVNMCVLFCRFVIIWVTLVHANLLARSLATMTKIKLTLRRRLATGFTDVCSFCITEKYTIDVIIAKIINTALL